MLAKGMLFSGIFICLVAGALLPVGARPAQDPKRIPVTASVPRRESADPFSVRDVQPPPAARTVVPPLERVNRFAPVTDYNVKNFGAVCDGSTDDTAAIQNAYDTAAVAMNKQGGAGVVYFPPSSGYCKVSTLHIPSMGYTQGWLTSIFDNGLFVTDTIYPGKNNAFIGRTSNFAAMGNVFLWGPSAEWQKPKIAGITAAPVVDMQGASQIYFEGIAFGDASEEAPETIHMHDDSNGHGDTNVFFNRCSIMGDLDVDSDRQNFAGFGLHIKDTAMGNVNIQNFGMITITGGYLHKVTLANTGNFGAVGDLEIADTLSEALTNENFLTVDTSGGTVTDITLRRVSLADPVGSVYMLKHVNNSNINWNVDVEFDMIPFNQTGSGLIDPSSAPRLLSVNCIGSNCGEIVNQAKSTLYMFVGIPPKSPMILYGSQDIGNPLVIIH